MTENSNPTILLVDDEEMVLNSMKSFFAIENNYNLMTYTSPLKALEDLNRNHAHVDLVISGHSHCYNRGSTNGVAYVVSGGGGGVLDVERVANWPLYTVEYSKYHYDLMEVNGHTLSWQTYDENNSLIDLFTLRSRIPALSWQGPVSGGLSLSLAGKPGVTYVLESSADLLTWSSFATNTIPSAGQSLIAASSLTGSQRFFRARL